MESPAGRKDLPVLDTVSAPRRIFHCRSCGSVLIFTDTDVTVRSARDIDHDYHEWHVIACPTCQKRSKVWETPPR